MFFTINKATRNLPGCEGDTGAFIRTTMGALVLFGVPPEDRWPYSVEHFDEEPSAFCYAFAGEYHALQYFRLDPRSVAMRLRRFELAGRVGRCRDVAVRCLNGAGWCYRLESRLRGEAERWRYVS